MTVAEVAGRHYRNTARLIGATVAATRRAWRRVSESRIAESWVEDVGPELIVTLTEAQLAVLEQSDGYVDAVLEVIDDEGAGSPRLGRVDPFGWAGEASDGRSLEGLLFQPVVASLAATRSGMRPRDALRVGEVVLERIVQTQVADASRGGDQAAMAARPKVTGYVRILTPPSCPRCVILAGKFYRWNDGFERHPNCDCKHIPATDETDPNLIDPVQAIRNGQVRGLSKADTRAILEDGADPFRVINAHRGMFTADGRKLTREGTFRGRRSRRAPARPRPETIYREAESREEAVRLLREHGYLA